MPEPPTVETPVPTAAPLPSVPEHRSTMLTRFGAFGRFLMRRAFSRVQMPEESVARVRTLARQGTIVYVLGYRSPIDHLLVNAVLLREGLPLARFAPGISTVLWRPVGEAFRWLFRRAEDRPAAHSTCTQTLSAGAPVVLFLRHRVASRSRRRILAAARLGLPFLRDVVRTSRQTTRPTFLVPIAIFRGAGFRRRESRLASLLYSVQEAPGEAKRLFMYVWNAEQTRITVGQDLRVDHVAGLHPGESEDRIARRLGRAMQLDLHRAERVVHGPALLPHRDVRAQVLRDRELVRLIGRLEKQRGVPVGQVRRDAAKMIDGMAANFNGVYFGVIEWLVSRVLRTIFTDLRTPGLARVAEYMKDHPVVLVPCHRSHFDYLILTYICHQQFLSPPHIAAGDNLSFWPMGPLFRAAGAYFIRRSFEDDELYKGVFRAYLAFLIRHGYTQEFFIEGGRARTGKMLTPKLGMLTAIVNAFGQGVRRDLYLVPISIHYGRIPEEDTYRREVSGEAKQRESLLALLKARTVLQRRYGTVYVSYGEPMSLREAMGPLAEGAMVQTADAAFEEEKRRFVQRLGFRLLRAVNAVAVAGATSVSATVLLGHTEPALDRDAFVDRARALVGLLRHQGVTFTESLKENDGSGFRDSIKWLVGGGLVELQPYPEGMALCVPDARRLNLDFYKNNVIHFFLVPSLVTRAVERGVVAEALVDHVAWWLEWLRWEFPVPPRAELAVTVESTLTYYRAVEALTDEGLATQHPLVIATRGIVDNFREAYTTGMRIVAARTEWPVGRGALLKELCAQYETSRRLGHARKSEGGTSITFGNLLSRLVERGHVTVTKTAGARDPVVDRGPLFAEIDAVVARLQA